MLAWIQIVTSVLLAGILLGAVVSAVISRLWMGKLRQMVPQARFVLVAVLALLPLLSGLLALAVVFAPSMLDAHGIVDDHCEDHLHHVFHVCFLHGSPPPVSNWFVGCSLAGLFLLGSNWAREINVVRRAERWSQQLSQLSLFDDLMGVWVAQTNQPLAVTVGLIHPRIFISTRVQEVTTADQYRTVLAHEQAHVRRRDGLMKLLVQFGASFQFKGPRKLLLEELEVAAEQACDEAAAHVLGDRLLVAETILKMRRELNSAPAATMGFSASALERRVQGMLDGHAQAPPNSTFSLFGMGLLATIVISYDELHHAAEALLSQLF